MTTDMRPYSEYKDSALPWLGRIPLHWDVRRNGRLFAQRNEIGHGSLPILEVSLNTGVRVRDMENLKRKQVMSDREKYKRAVKGDIAYNMMRMWQGAVGVAPEDGLVSPAYVVARPYPEAESRYFSYLFRTDAYKNEVDGYSRGIVKDRNRLYWEDFKRMPSCFPPLQEQKVIASFLDAIAVKIRFFIRNRHRLIELLNERKQAIINRAVTRGLDPNASLKPSGIDYLGDVPKHWNVLTLKRVTTLIIGGATPDSSRAEYWDGEVVWVTPADISKTDLLLDSQRHLSLAGLAACSAVIVPAGSVVFTSRAPVGNTAIATVPLCTNQGCKAIVPMTSRLIGDYLLAELMVMKAHLQSIAKGTTFTEIDTWTFANQFVIVPPVREQEQIVSKIKADTASIDIGIRNAQREINLIREYRIRLITDVVTGKVDIRHLAPAEQLPVEEAIDEDVEDVSMSEDNDPEQVEGALDADE